MVLDKEFNKVAILSEITDYSIGLKDSFKQYFKGEVFDETYQTGITDARTLALKIISQKPEAIILNPSSVADGLAVLVQIRQLGFKAPIYGNYFGAVGDVLKSPNADDMVFFTDPDVKSNIIKENLYSKFEVNLGRKPNFDFAVAISYDSVYILKTAMEQVGPEPAALKDYLHNLRDFNGVMGTYGFKDNGDATGYVPSIKKIKEGKVVPI